MMHTKSILFYYSETVLTGPLLVFTTYSLMVTDSHTIGCSGRSLPSHLALLIAITTSMPLATLPKTGCWDGVLLSKKSRNELCTVLMKNWLPPELGWPVLAIENVPGSLDSFGQPGEGV